MWFRIEKASNVDEKPHNKAIIKKGYIVDERRWGSVDEMPERWRKEWYERGISHRVENGHIKRDIEIEDWYIEINTLDELMKLIKECGYSLVIDGEKIIIYDDYLE